LNGNAGSFAKYLRNLEGALLICDGVRCDETDPEMVYAERAVFSEDLLDGALNGRGEFFQGNCRWGHWITSQRVKIGDLEGADGTLTR
jgi:hypothetical protein